MINDFTLDVRNRRITSPDKLMPYNEWQRYIRNELSQHYITNLKPNKYHTMSCELNKLKEYASRCIRKEYDNADIYEAIECIELADELGLKEVYKEMLDDFLYYDENRAFWLQYVRKRDEHLYL